jgi:hypothetical protein
MLACVSLRQVSVLLLALVSTLNLGANCYGGGTSPGVQPAPSQPPTSVVYPNGYICPIRCESRTRRITEDYQLPVCIPNHLNSNLPGGPAFSLYEWENIKRWHCERVVAPSADHALNFRNQVCDTQCRVEEFTSLSFLNLTNSRCNENCPAETALCDTCTRIGNCGAPLCEVSRLSIPDLEVELANPHVQPEQ